MYENAYRGAICHFDWIKSRTEANERTKRMCRWQQYSFTETLVIAMHLHECLWHLPVAPVNRLLINSLLFVKFVSHDAHEYNLMPLMWSNHSFPMFFSSIFFRFSTIFTHARQISTGLCCWLPTIFFSCFCLYFYYCCGSSSSLDCLCSSLRISCVRWIWLIPFRIEVGGDAALEVNFFFEFRFALEFEIPQQKFFPKILFLLYGWGRVFQTLWCRPTRNSVETNLMIQFFLL